MWTVLGRRGESTVLLRIRDIIAADCTLLTTIACGVGPVALDFPLATGNARQGQTATFGTHGYDRQPTATSAIN